MSLGFSLFSLFVLLLYILEISFPNYQFRFQSCPLHYSAYPIEFLFICLFVYFWLRLVFVAVHGLSLVAASGGYSLLRCAGFSLRWLLLLQSTGSRRAGFSSCGSRALECRLSSCGAWASLLFVALHSFPDKGSNPCPLHWQADS